MHIVVHVAEERLHGVSFQRYSSVLGNLIDEGHNPDECNIVPGAETTVTIDGRTKGEDVAEILSMAKEIALSDFVDGLFIFAEWKALYGDRAVDPETVPKEELDFSTAILSDVAVP